MIEIFSLAGGKYTLDQIEVEDFQDSEEDRRSETFSDLTEPEVGIVFLGLVLCKLPCPGVTI